jgi:hypothetical protein
MTRREVERGKLYVREARERERGRLREKQSKAERERKSERATESRERERDRLGGREVCVKSVSVCAAKRGREICEPNRSHSPPHSHPRTHINTLKLTRTLKHTHAQKASIFF